MSNPLFQEYEHPVNEAKSEVGEGPLHSRQASQAVLTPSLETEKEQLKAQAHNQWVLENLGSKILAPYRGIEISGRQSRTSLVPFEVLNDLYNRYVAKVGSASKVYPDVVEYNGAYYHVNIYPTEFLELLIVRTRELEKQDSRAGGILTEDNLRQIQGFINSVENLNLDESGGFTLDFEGQKEVFQKWMIELAVDRRRDNDLWFENLKALLDLLGIDYVDLSSGNIDTQQKTQLLQVVQDVRMLERDKNTEDLVNSIYQSNLLVRIAITAHHNWRSIRYDSTKPFTTVANTQVFSNKITVKLAEMLTCVQENLAEYVSNVRKEYEADLKVSSSESLYFLYLIATTLSSRDDVQDPQVQAVLNDLVAQIKADFNPALLQAIIKIYERSGKSFWDGLEDV